MLPPLRIRLAMALVILIGGACWVLAAGWLRAPDAASGLAMSDAAHPFSAAVMLIIFGLPALAGALALACIGNPLSGFFTLGAALLWLATAGGSAEGWLRRHALGDELTGGLRAVALEAGVWAVALAALMMVLARLRPWVRQRLGPRWVCVDEPAAGRLEPPTPGALLAGVVAAAIGLGMSWLMVRTDDIGQVVGSVLLSFTIAGLLARLLVPHRNISVVLLSPALAGLAGYVWLLVSGSDADLVLRRWYAGQLAGPMLVLPLHWVAAGLTGVTFGLGMAQGLLAGSRELRQQKRHEADAKG